MGDAQIERPAAFLPLTSVRMARRQHLSGHPLGRRGPAAVAMSIVVPSLRETSWCSAYRKGHPASIARERAPPPIRAYNAFWPREGAPGSRKGLRDSPPFSGRSTPPRRRARGVIGSKASMRRPAWVWTAARRVVYVLERQQDPASANLDTTGRTVWRSICRRAPTRRQWFAYGERRRLFPSDPRGRGEPALAKAPPITSALRDGRRPVQLLFEYTASRLARWTTGDSPWCDGMAASSGRPSRTTAQHPARSELLLDPAGHYEGICTRRRVGRERIPRLVVVLRRVDFIEGALYLPAN